MQIETTSGPDCTFVKPLERRIDASSASGLKEKIQECIRAGAKHIVLDLSMVDFIDSSGLGAIISIRKVLGEGGDLSLAAPKDAVVSLLKLTRMDKIFRLYKEPEAALGDISPRLTMSPIAIELTIDSRLENVALVGVAFNKICESAGMDALECYQMELCLVEAVTNCIKHAYGSRPGNNVSVQVTLDERNLELQIRDKGPPAAGVFASPSTLEFDPNDLQQVPTSGMGVFIIQSIMDGVEYHREGDTNILTLTKELKARSPA